MYPKSHHKYARLDWAQKYRSYGNKWITILFNPEKRLSMDGPDSWNCYRHDLQK